jgi:hypothetical protein
MSSLAICLPRTLRLVRRAAHVAPVAAMLALSILLDLAAKLQQLWNARTLSR